MGTAQPQTHQELVVPELKSLTWLFRLMVWVAVSFVLVLLNKALTEDIINWSGCSVPYLVWWAERQACIYILALERSC